ncbi:transposase [Chitinophagaceae bacterium LB-8]|uniref:Transposase n=1 Tax=Paraflavisolibacter caeni TaxID=2982496 RepID=A0A9X2XQ06_9BACT|nr:transposase [Paraflavisolibacter caeni]MCU7552299.1 transposase [Paraflavisolibacter caeni]
MATQRRKFTDEEKLDILQQANKMGITAVLRTHNLSYSVFTKWKQKFMKSDINTDLNSLIHKARSEIKLLIEENTRLKKIIAHQALELELKDEELKKTNDLLKKNK